MYPKDVVAAHDVENASRLDVIRREWEELVEAQMASGNTRRLEIMTRWGWRHCEGHTHNKRAYTNICQPWKYNSVNRDVCDGDSSA